MAGPSAPSRSSVPWRTIWATIFSVGVAYIGYQSFLAIGRITTYVVVAVFFAIVLTPPVDFLQHKAKLRRGLAATLVILIGLGLFAAMLYAFIKPLAESATNFSRDLPQYVEDAKNGKGPVGDLVTRYDLEQKVKDNQDKIQQAVADFGKNGLNIVQSVFSTIVATLTIGVLTILILLEGPHLSESILNFVPDDGRRERVRKVAVDAARAVSGYVFGNLLISVIAGVAAWIMLYIAGVPYAEVLGLFVAFADLIPLIGASLGAVPTIAFAFVHSVPAGVASIIFFVIYQQFENNVLQVTIMARTVKLNPLAVLISVLIGVELFGFLGALLAIPAAGIIQVIARDIYDDSRGRLKTRITIGADEVDADDIEADKADDAHL